MSNISTLENILEMTVKGLGYKLFSIEFYNKQLTLYIDSINGITVDDCVVVSNHISKLLTAEDFDYSRLSVSSIGANRKLKSISDYKKSIGKMVTLKTYDDGNKKIDGVLKEVQEDSLIIAHQKGTLVINFDNINKISLKN